MNANSLKIIAFAIVIFSAIWLLMDGCDREYKPVTKTDTVYVNKIWRDTVVISKPSKSRIVKVYLPDSVRRARMEKRTLIAGVKLNSKGLEVATIDTSGIVRVALYPVPERFDLAISDTGMVAIKEKQPRKLKAAKWFIVGLGAGYLAGKVF